MAVKKKKKEFAYGRYATGADVYGTAGMFGGQLLSDIVGQDTGAGSFLSGAGSGIGTGAAIGSIVPGIGTAIGAGVGALIGGVGGFLGNSKKQRELERLQKQQKAAFDQSYMKQYTSQVADNNNQNPYGNQLYADGGIVDPNVRNIWNQYVDYLDSLKIKGSPKLNDPKLAKKYFDEFTLKNKLNLDYNTFIPQVQSSMIDYRNKAIDQIKTGKAGWDKYDPKAQDPFAGFMKDLSRNDGIAGQQTTNWKFPTTTIKSISNPKEILGKNTVYANGGEVFPNIINIEKNELQIDPQSGKILREYTGINPETGGLYKPHSTKGKDTNHNMVTAEPNTFIVTKAKSKEYKKAIDENDKLKQNTILQNIRNYKAKVTPSNKFATGGNIIEDFSILNPYGTQPIGSPQIPYLNKYQDLTPVNTIGLNTNNTLKGTLPALPDTRVINSNNNKFNLNKVLDVVANYGPAALNIGQGLFGKVEQQPYGTKTINPFLQNTLNNLPQDISYEPMRQEAMRQQRQAFNRIDTGTSSSAIARSNKNALLGQTQNTLAKIRLDNQLANNSIRSQRGSIYNQLGQQDMQEQNRLQNYNFNVDQINAQNRGAKQNLLSTGLGQLQQTYQNQRSMKAKDASAQQQIELLKQIFPNMNYYDLFNQFGG